MTRKKNDSQKDGPVSDSSVSDSSVSGGSGNRRNGSSPNAAGRGAEIISLDSSPAFDRWLARQTRKLVEASTPKTSQSLVDLIRSWPGDRPEAAPQASPAEKSPSAKSPKKNPGKITD